MTRATAVEEYEITLSHQNAGGTNLFHARGTHEQCLAELQAFRGRVLAGYQEWEKTGDAYGQWVRLLDRTVEIAVGIDEHSEPFHAVFNEYFQALALVTRPGSAEEYEATGFLP